MSIYSGFATRAQQETYDQCLDSLIYVLQKRIIKFYKNQETDELKFISIITKIHNQLKNMQNNKYLDPRSSNSINQLVKFMNIHASKMSQLGRQYLQQPKKQINILPDLNKIQKKDVNNQQNTSKKKNSLWVAKNTQKNTIDKQIQTVGLIYGKKDNHVNQSDSKSKYEQDKSNNKLKNDIKSGRTIYHTNYKPHNSGLRQKKLSKHRTNSYHVKKLDDIELGLIENRDHLRQIQQIQKKKRQSKLQSRLGVKQFTTQQASNDNQISDIIKDYLIRVKKSYARLQKKNANQSSTNKLNDF